MQLMRILSYVLETGVLLSVLVFAYYFVQGLRYTGKLKKYYREMIGVIPFIISSVILAVDGLFSFMGGWYFPILITWMGAILTLAYSKFLIWKDIHKVYPYSFLKMVREESRRKYDAVGIFILTFVILPLYLLNVLLFAFHKNPWSDFFTSAVLLCALISLAIGARKEYFWNMRSQGRQQGEGFDEESSLSGDARLVKIYTQIVNQYLTGMRSFADLARKSLLEFFENNPILFAECTLREDGTIDFNAIEQKISQINDEERTQDICMMFSVLISKLVEIYTTVTSPEQAREMLAESYHKVQEIHGSSTEFFDILRSLPADVLEEKRIALLPREELEVRIKERTAQLYQAKLELEQAKNYMNNIIESMADALIVVDHEGKITEVNRATVELLGYRRGELLGKSVDIVAEGEETLSGIKSELVRDHNKEGFISNIERIYRAKDGKRIPVLLSCSRMTEDGKNQGIIYMARDITQRKEVQEKLQRTLRQLEDALEGNIRAMARTVEARDAYTSGHQQRVTELACAIASEMGLPEEMIRGIHTSATIHDIGKIVVPAEVLSKPGRLTDLEFALIKNHPKVAYDIVKEVKFPWPVAQIILQHHERIDGSGYPHGLEDKDILIEARVLAVADVVEAMSSHRPYRPALGIDKALKEIEENKGKLYDPRVVDACLTLFKEKKFHLDKE